MRWTNGITSFYQGDCREVLAELPAESVQCVVTSPPYWGLRDYGTDGQLGLEETPDAYVATMVEVFRAVRRVLRKDGTVWLNLGDSYVGTGHKGKYTDPKHREGRNGQVVAINNTVDGLKSKDLVGIPWRVALALQADGWYLRSDIIWSKPNPMPEPVQDRPTKAHEYIFLLTKSPKYYYDADAIREDSKWERWGAQTIGKQYRGINPIDMDTLDDRREQGRNKRSVWEITTQPYPEAHFATFPEALVTPCIMAGTKEQDTVLDPFAGSGTVMQVAQQLGRKSIGVELNDEYIDLAAKRLERIPFPMIGI
jgi:DNA modification methylase